MTTKPTAPPAVASAGHFPELPPRDDMQNTRFLNEPAHLPALRVRLGFSASTVVTSETPIGWNTSQRRGLLQPDLLIAFDVDSSVIIAEQGYSIDYHGKPPDFVLEIASPTTSSRDETDKRRGYADFRVLEYWRFDDTGGRYYQTALAGDHLVSGTYQPIDIVEVSHARYRGYSAVLGLYVCWEYGHLRWYDPETGYLPTYYEETDARIAAEAERDAERAERLRLEAEIRLLRNQ